MSLSPCRVPSSVSMVTDQPSIPGRRRWLHVHPDWSLRNGSALQARLEKRRYRNQDQDQDQNQLSVTATQTVI